MTRLSIRLQLTDPTPTLILTMIPFVLAPFVMPTFKSMLLANGYVDITGIEQVVPSITILFSLPAVQNTISLFSNGHSWGMWEYLEASLTSRATILTSKALVAFLMQTIQIAVALVLGALILEYRPTGSLVALTAVLLNFSAILSMLGAALALWSHSHDMVLSLSDIIGMLAAGVGGSFPTVSPFPDWAQRAVRLSPTYQAITTVHEVSLNGASLADARTQIGILWGLFVVIAGLALVQFRYHREQQQPERGVHTLVEAACVVPRRHFVGRARLSR